MATVTPNFNWPVPTSTDLVKDGATAIEALGDSIDASLVDLKGGTTGQVLSKNSNTDMDFVWVTDAAGDITGVTAGTGISGGGTSGTVTVTNSMATAIDAKGDLVPGTGADTFARLAVGANGTVLTADSAEATGLKWATPTSTAFVGCSLTNGSEITVANNTDQALTFDTENYDTDSMHSTSTNLSRITIPTGKGGYYEFRWGGVWGSNTSGNRRLRLRKNGTTDYQSSAMTTKGDGLTAISASTVVSASAGDYFELMAFQDSGGNLAIGAGTIVGFEASKVG